MSHSHHATGAALGDDEATPASVTPGEAVTTLAPDQQKCTRVMECERCLELRECQFVTFKVTTINCMNILLCPAFIAIRELRND